jgi:hypothetical protein
VLVVEKGSQPSTIDQRFTPAEKVAKAFISRVVFPATFVIALESEYFGFVPAARSESQNEFTAESEPWPANAALTPVLAL